MAKEEGAEIVDLSRFTDLPGQVQHLSVPVHELTEDKFEHGQPFDGSSIRGFQEIQESDMLLDLDPDTAYMDPFTKHPTLNITCFVKDPVTGEDYSRDPRNIAKKAELYLKQSGIADLSYWGPEAEFYIFDSIRSTSRSSRGTTTSIPSRARGAAARWRRVATSATSHGSRAGTSRFPRSTSTRTCGPTWCSTWRRWA